MERFLCSLVNRLVMERLFIFTIIVSVVAVLLAGCKGNRNSASDWGGTPIKMKYADNIKISEGKDFTLVEVINPWDTAHNLQRYILVDRNRPIPDSLPSGVVVKVPVKDALVYSTVHVALIKELGKLDAISGICSAEYVTDPDVKTLIAKGKIKDCGNNMAPDMERIIKLNPEAILLSPYENGEQYASVSKLGIPFIEGADYMETSPLGRAEWMRFYGLLFGARNESEQLFADTEKRYLELAQKGKETTTRPTVLLDQRYGQVWDVPAANSTTGILIRDAGGNNPFAVYKGSGSVALDPEKVLVMAHDADIWLVRYFQKNPKTLKELADDAPVNSQFKAFKVGNVWGCNTSKSGFFEETPFHPDRTLEEFLRIIHPELNIPGNTRYYHRMK